MMGLSRASEPTQEYWARCRHHVAQKEYETREQLGELEEQLAELLSESNEDMTPKKTVKNKIPYFESPVT